MKITNLEIIPLCIPIKSERLLGVGALKKIENIIIRIQTDNGLVGIGEASPWEVFSENSKSVYAVLKDYITPAIIGKNPFNIEEIMKHLDKIVVGASFAKAGIEIGLFDLIGKALNTPVYNLLGGICREGVKLSYSVAARSVESEIEEIVNHLEKGVQIFKVKTGILEHRQDISRIERFAVLLEGKAELRIDYNQAIRPEQAIKYCRELEKFNPTFIEQPLSFWDIAGMSRIAKAIDTPIMADESVFSLFDAMKVVKAEAADIISIKLMKAGGIRNSQRIAAIAAAANIPCYSGLMWESSIGMSASLHLAVATETISCGGDYYIPYFLMESDIVLNPPQFENGIVKPNDGPGLGVILDEEKISLYRQNN